MTFTDTLYEKTRKLWDKAAAKDFVIGMAKGTLSPERFRNYMIQDYLYLQDYLGLLGSLRDLAKDPRLLTFLQSALEETEHETYRVHVPAMRALGITDDEVAGVVKSRVITEYVDYMKAAIAEGGLAAGVTALLQCSWAYAYIAAKVATAYAGELSGSPYRSWFDGYTCKEYVEANEDWIRAVDELVGGVPDGLDGGVPDEGGLDEETLAMNGSACGASDADRLVDEDRLVEIFVTCAEFEDRLWDEF